MRLPKLSPGYWASLTSAGLLILMAAGGLAAQAISPHDPILSEADRLTWASEPIMMEVRLVRDPVTNCEYIETKQGITPRLWKDGSPHCPVSVTMLDAPIVEVGE